MCQGLLYYDPIDKNLFLDSCTSRPSRKLFSLSSTALRGTAVFFKSDQISYYLWYFEKARNFGKNKKIFHRMYLVTSNKTKKDLVHDPDTMIDPIWYKIIKSHFCENTAIILMWFLSFIKVMDLDSIVAIKNNLHSIWWKTNETGDFGL